MGFRIASEKLFRIASDLGVCDSNRIAHRGCIARFGPLRCSPRDARVLGICTNYYSRLYNGVLYQLKSTVESTLPIQNLMQN